MHCPPSAIVLLCPSPTHLSNCNVARTANAPSLRRNGTTHQPQHSDSHATHVPTPDSLPPSAMSSPAPSLAAPTPCVLIGAGQRGICYTNYALDHPELLCVVGVAEPNAQRRQDMAAKFNLGPEVQFESWEAMLAARQAADPAAKPGSAIAVIATPDALHHGPAVAFARAGYHILLEKPMAVQPKECKEIAEAAQASGALFAVCVSAASSPLHDTQPRTITAPVSHLLFSLLFCVRVSCSARSSLHSREPQGSRPDRRWQHW